MYDAGNKHSLNIDLKLPIAPVANYRMLRDGDTRPAPAMVPAEAVAWVQALRNGGKNIRSIELIGPGDILATVSRTLDCLKLLGPEIKGADLRLSTIGLGAAEVATDLARLGVVKVTLLVDTVQAETATKLYSWIRPAKKNVPLASASEMLIAAQAAAVEAFTAAGINVAIRTNLVAGINDTELVQIAEIMADIGASSIEIDGKVGVDLEKHVRLASEYLRATLCSNKLPELLPPGSPGPCDAVTIPKSTATRPNVAVVSTNGMDVDLHLGQASQVLIYGPRDDGLACLLMARQTPGTGGGSERWQILAKECLHDCFALLATHAGDVPRKELAELGIQVVLTEDNIEGLVDVLYGGGKKKKCK